MKNHNHADPFTFAPENNLFPATITPLLIGAGQLTEQRPDLAAALREALVLHSVGFRGLYTGLDGEEENATKEVTFTWYGEKASQVALLMEDILMVLNGENFGDAEKNKYDLAFIESKGGAAEHAMIRAWALDDCTLKFPFGQMEVGRGLLPATQCFELTFYVGSRHYGLVAMEILQEEWDECTRQKRSA